MYTSKRLSTGRLVIHDLLRRSRRHHSPSTGIFDWDYTDTLARLTELRERGVPVNRAAFLTKATALAVREHRRLNTRMFFPLRGPREVTFDEVSCNLVIHRKEGGEDRLFPVVLRHVDTMPVIEIAERIRHYKTAPAGDLQEVAAQKRLSKVPRILTRLHDFKVLTDPAYYIKHFGTYGLSTLVHEDSGLVSGFTTSPSTTFYPGTIQEKPVVRNGKVVPRTILSFGMIVDHQVIDGLPAIAAGKCLKELIENPEHILGDL